MKLLLYCTKAKPYLNDYRKFEFCNCFTCMPKKVDDVNLNGKIVAECNYEVETYLTERSWLDIGIRVVNKRLCKGVAISSLNDDMLNSILSKSCLTNEELANYMNFERNIINQKELYAIYIKYLHIFDEPKELSDYITKQCQYGKCSTCEHCRNGFPCITIDTPITKAPQNMMYAFDKEGREYIVISIQPQWLCKILNKEKTIEVRKKVLKEMLNNE